METLWYLASFSAPLRLEALKLEKQSLELEEQCCILQEEIKHKQKDKLQQEV